MIWALHIGLIDANALACAHGRDIDQDQGCRFKRTRHAAAHQLGGARSLDAGAILFDTRAADFREENWMPDEDSNLD